MITIKMMHLGSSNLLFLFALALISWTFGRGSDEIVSVIMEKRASFYNSLPLTSVCYHSEIKNTSKRRCLSQCLTHHEMCTGILFNKERQACKLIDCYPSDAFPGLGFDTGRWDLFSKTTGIKLYFYKDHFFFMFFLSLKEAVSYSG